MGLKGNKKKKSELFSLKVCVLQGMFRLIYKRIYGLIMLS